MSLNIEQLPFGQMPDGSQVTLFRLTNEAGAVAEISSYGATLVGVIIPDKNGKMTRVVKGFPSVEGYLADLEIGTYLGATCGRYANRINKGRFTLDGEDYQLACNNGENHLHGGPTGYHSKNWAFEVEEDSVVFSLTSKDGEEGFPGNLKMQVRYAWSITNELSIHYSAVCDKNTPLNLTSHAYFNLAGEGDILGHEMKIHADKFVPIHADAIPTGEIRLVKGGAFDFSEFKAIGQDINADDEQLKNGCGYDHCFVINKKEYGDLALAVEVKAPSTGCCLNVWTSLPGVQFYSGNYLRSEVPSCDGKPLEYRGAFCLEPEFFPDSPNQSGFPNCILPAGEEFDQTIIYQFSTEN